MSEGERVARILAGWRARRDGGEAVAPEDVIREHPDLGDELRRAFSALALLDRAVGEAVAGAVGARATAGGVPGRIGDFLLIRELGRGATGDVYEADQTSMRRRVALKILHPATTLSPKAVERFRREAQVAGRLHHTNIVPVHAMGTDHGLSWFAMELVPGQPLSQVIENLRRLARTGGHGVGSSPEPSGGVGSTGFGTTSGGRDFYVRVARTFAGVADALDAAHAAGVIHRDVKPSNLLLDDAGVLKLLDFGLARAEQDGLPSLTMTGDVVGTPAYMSPEQVRGLPADARTDVYGLGATLYELLTLRPPFRGRDVADCLRQVATSEPAAPRRVNPRIPRDLETIVGKAMEKDPGRRYGTAADLARDLVLFAEGAGIKARRVGPVGRAWRVVRRHRVRVVLAALALLGALGAAGFAWVAQEERSSRVVAESRRREAEYADLLAAADEEVRTNPASGSRVAAIYSRAIDLLPERFEAWLWRAVAGNGGRDQTLTDLAAAEARGAPQRAIHLARAGFHWGEAEDTMAAAEEARAMALPATDLESMFLESRLALVRGQVARALPLLDEVVAKAPLGSGIAYLARRSRAEIRRTRGDRAGAISDLEVLHEEGDRSAWRVSQLAAVWRSLGETQKAEDLLAAFFERQEVEGSLEGWIRIGTQCGREREFAWAERAAKAGLAAYPDAPALLVLRGTLALEQGRLDDALRDAQRAHALGADPHHAEGLLGEVFRRSGEHAKAVEHLRLAASHDPACSSCRSNLSDALRRQGHLPEALQVAREATERSPTDPALRVNEGNILLDMERATDALAAYERALELDPRRVRAHQGRGQALLRLGQIQTGLEAFASGLALAPNDQGLLDQQGFGLYLAGDYPAARAVLERAVAIEGGSAFGHGKLGIVLDELGDTESALSEYAKAEELDPRQDEYPNNAAALLLRLDRFEEADAAAKRAAALREDDALPHTLSAGALLMLGKFEEAHAEARRAVACDATSGMAQWRLGQSLHALGRKAEAVEPFRKALATDPSNLNFLAWLGRTLRDVGNEAEAMGFWSRAVDVGCRDVDVLQGLAVWLVHLPEAGPDEIRRALRLAELAVARESTTTTWATLGEILARGRERGALGERAEPSLGLGGEAEALGAFRLVAGYQFLGERSAARRWYRHGKRLLPEELEPGSPLAAAEAEARAVLSPEPSPAVQDR